jgi:protein-S-isoprenylcysteine O-methyltransferase Ste14
MVWARLTFGRRSFHAAANPTGDGLVTTRPFRYLRRPIYPGALYFVRAGVFAHLLPANIRLGILVAANLAVRMVAEERLVTQRYPE